jgi:hypothetical protein
MYERKYAHFYKAANHFVSTLTTEKRDEIQLNLENMEKKMAAGNLPEMEKELQIKNEIFKYLEEGYYQKMVCFCQNNKKLTAIELSIFLVF